MPAGTLGFRVTDEIEPGALWEDLKTSFNLGVRHHKAWERSAIVTDIEWMAHATKLFAWMSRARRACSASTSWTRPSTGWRERQDPRRRISARSAARVCAASRSSRAISALSPSTVSTSPRLSSL